MVVVSHLEIVPNVLSQIPLGHAALAEFTLDGVAVGQGGLQAIQSVGHGGLLEGWKTIGIG